MPNIKPIFCSPYPMSPEKAEVLKDQLAELPKCSSAMLRLRDVTINNLSGEDSNSCLAFYFRQLERFEMFLMIFGHHNKNSTKYYRFLFVLFADLYIPYPYENLSFTMNGSMITM